MALFTETVSRTFTGGALEGLTMEVSIPRVSDPRRIGTVHEVAKPCGGTSPYRDEVIAVERWEG